MADEPIPGATTTQPSHATTDLALDRTMLAQERTLMAWTRTATSLISFGFTIYTFFENFGVKHATPRFFGASHYALMMISIGLICLVLASMRNWRDSRQFEAQYGVKPPRLALALALLIACLGVYGLLAVLFR